MFFGKERMISQDLIMPTPPSHLPDSGLKLVGPASGEQETSTGAGLNLVTHTRLTTKALSSPQTMQFRVLLRVTKLISTGI